MLQYKINFGICYGPLSEVSWASSCQSDDLRQIIGIELDLEIVV